MTKRLLFIVACAICAAICPGASQGQNVENTPSNVSFKGDQDAIRIATLCERAKAEYDSKYREFPEGTPNDVEKLPKEQDPEYSYFAENCDALASAFSSFRATSSRGSLTDASRALGEIVYYQSKSPRVKELVDALREYFSQPNFYVEISENLLSAVTRRPITQDFTVNETVRGTLAQGRGVARGFTMLKLYPNPNRAEMAIVLNANVSTSTVGASRGVNVFTDNYGNVLASKRVYLNSDGLLSTSASAASGAMRSELNSFATDLPTPFGGMFIQNKIQQELPYAEQESAVRMRQRFTAELDNRANVELSKINATMRRVLEGDPVVRDMESQTTSSRLYLSCTLGRSWQLGAPSQSKVADIKTNSERSSQQNDADCQSPTKIKTTYGVPKSRGFNNSVSYRAQAPAYGRTQRAAFPAPTNPIESILSLPRDLALSVVDVLDAPKPAPSIPSVEAANASTNNARYVEARVNAPVASQYQSNAVAPRSDSDVGKLDLVVKVYQTAPNNALSLAFSGAKIGTDSDRFEDVIARFTGLDLESVKAILPTTKPKNPTDGPEKSFSVEFDEVEPFTVSFDSDKISTVVKVGSCTVDGKEYDPFEIRLVYRLEKRDRSYYFVRDDIEVVPHNYVEGDFIPRSFLAFSSLFMKNLEAELENEYKVPVLSLDDEQTNEKRGALVPAKVEVKSGWLAFGFRYDPNARAL